MPLDPQAQILLEQLAMLEEFYEPSLEEIRRRNNASSVIMGELEAVGHVENRSLAGPGGPLQIRIYTPSGSGPFPMLIYLHGGGWIIGNLAMDEPLCRNLANTAQCIVISVDYRLAPENKFPAALEDAFFVTQWVANNARDFNGDPDRLAVGGDSAGGNLAAVVALMARDKGGPTLAYQVLLYPSTDLSVTLDPTKTGVEYAMNTLERAYFHTECYVNTWEETKNPLVSPLLAENLAGLPPTLLVTAEYDLLLEQDQRYAERLQEAGVPVTSRHYSEMMHGFINMADFLDQGKQALTEVGMALHSVFYPSEYPVAQGLQEQEGSAEKGERLQEASPVEE